jgi:hypothetical protein
METWIEIEDTFLTNQPVIIEGRGKNRRRVPDPDVEPTEMYLSLYDCRRTKKGVSRKRRLQTFKGENAADLDQQLMDFTVRDGVMLVQVDDPLKYTASRAEPDPIMIGGDPLPKESTG